LRILPGAGVLAARTLANRNWTGGVDDLSAVVQDLQASVFERDHDFRHTVVVEVTDRQTSARSRQRVAMGAIPGVGVVALEPVLVAAHGEVILTLVFAATVHRAHDPV